MQIPPELELKIREAARNQVELFKQRAELAQARTTPESFRATHRTAAECANCIAAALYGVLQAAGRNVDPVNELNVPEYLESLANEKP